MKRKLSPAQEFVRERKFLLKGQVARLSSMARQIVNNPFLHPHERDGIREAIRELGPIVAHFDTYTTYLEKERKL